MLEQSIFIDALDIDNPADRQAYLDQVCAGDSRLRAQIDELIKAHERTGHFMMKPAPVLVAEGFTICEGPGTLIGPYKLLEKIGEGGFGVVFMAEQQKPVRRKVALKVTKVGMDTRQVVARFEAERQALALMDHPNIAKVLDAGATETGRPFFVMELIKGLPITEYCDQSLLTVPERLQLFITVCQAVQHAHQKGIIHRDIKPTNVLVTLHDGVPVVKVIDFGIAKATGQQLTEKTLFTNFAQMIGTPLYMSPEQAALSGLDVDTRSDIYSLGVLLYELLTGTTPFEKERLRSAAYDEMRRIIREEEPLKPSTRVSTLAQASTVTFAQRKCDPKSLSKIIRGDLDWIVMKSLEKDRKRRYESASAFASDLQRHLRNEPVEACPPSTSYRCRKFAKRNARVLTATALVTAALLLGGIGLANQQFQRVAVEQAVTDDLAEAETFRKQEQWDQALLALERAKGRLEGSGLVQFKAKVESDRRELALVARLQDARLQSWGQTEAGYRDFAAADTAFAKAFADNQLVVETLPAEEIAGRIRDSTIRSQLISALDYWAFVKDQMRQGSGEPLRAVARLADVDPWRNQLRDPKVTNDKAKLETIATHDGVLNQHPAQLWYLSNLLASANSPDARERLLRQAQNRYPADFLLAFELAKVLGGKDPAEALGFYRVARALQPANPVIHVFLGNALRNQQKLPEAEAAYRNAIEVNPRCAPAYCNLGGLLCDQGKVEIAIKTLEKAIELDPNYALALGNLGIARNRQQNWVAGEAALLKAISLKKDYTDAYYNLGRSLFHQKKFAEAVEAFQKAIELRPNHAEDHCNLGNALLELGRFDRALAALELGNTLAQARPDWKYPSDKWAERARTLVRLDAKLPRVLRGEIQPTGAGECIELAELCAMPCRQYYAAATRFYREAFEDNPNLVWKNHYSAACAAALAGCGRGKDEPRPNDMERAHLRGQALAWIRAELGVWQSTIANPPKNLALEKITAVVRGKIKLWRDNPDLAGVRGDEAIAKLPDAERREWTRFWGDVAALERQASTAK